jgi:ketosteroid isomerase-like protein
MSEENVDLVRRIYEAWDREESARDFISEDVEYVNPSYAIEPGVRGSGVPLEGEHAHLWTVRDGMAVRFRWFQSHSEAVEAAGLDENEVDDGTG